MLASTKISSQLKKFEFDLIKFPDEPIVFSAPSWSDLHQWTFELATKIRKTDQIYDRLITLAKGGWPMTVPLFDLLNIPKIASVGVKFYSATNTKMKQPHMYQGLPVSIAGERILLFDDVADSGESLKFVTEYLFHQGAASVQTATLVYKPHSIVRPNFYAAETKTWIVFPYEFVESIVSLGGKWQKQGLGLPEIKSRLLKFGFKAEWLDSYLKNLLS